MKFLPHLAIILLSFSCVEDFSSFKEAPLMGYIPTFHANYYTEIIQKSRHMVGKAQFPIPEHRIS